jgi:methylated-DNA-[protein]-cysteine S-methyltransferase
MIDLTIDRIASPIGEILLVTDGNLLCALDFLDYESRMLDLLKKRYDSFAFTSANNPLGLRDRLTDYFNGKLNCFENLPTHPGGTPFQQQVWQQLQTIASGTTWTYGALAKSLGNPRASRAVGAANGLNPIAIVIPCHRVIGSNAKLTGYAGGIDRKAWLLNHEQQYSDKPYTSDKSYAVQGSIFC